VRDLLSGSPADAAGLQIRQDTDGRAVVSDLNILPATDPVQVETLLRQVRFLFSRL
jgi:hypothetical protein